MFPPFITGLPFCNSPVKRSPGSSSIFETESLKSQLFEALFVSGEGTPGGGRAGGPSKKITLHSIRY